MRELVIAGRRISDEDPCYVIAEVGHNHGGNVDTAKAMIKAAARAGASAVKLQKRENETLYAQALLDKPYDNENSFGATYGLHRAALEFGSVEYRACRAEAAVRSIDFFATAFDEASADFLYGLNVPALKMASGSLTDHALLKHVSSYGKPIILSTGGGTFAHVDAAVNTLSKGSAPFALLHCTAAYPVLNYAELNLLAIVEMRNRYPNTVIGWSGHDSGIAMALVAYAYGARIIEKHFTLNRAMKGTDHAFSLEPTGLRKLVRDLDRARLSSGDGRKVIFESERKPIAKMRRVQTVDGLRVTGSTNASY